MGCASKARKIVGLAMHRVTVRAMTSGLSLSYEQLLAETAAEVDALLDERRERDVRLLRLARKQLLEDRARLGAAVEFRAAAIAGQELADLDTAPGVPSWHPEHADHPENL